MEIKYIKKLMKSDGYTLDELKQVVKCINEQNNKSINDSGTRHELSTKIYKYIMKLLYNPLKSIKSCETINNLNKLVNLPYTNWIIKDKLLVGTYPIDEDIDEIKNLGIYSFISLLEKKEIRNQYESRKDIKYNNYEIPDRKAISNNKALEIAKSIKDRLDRNEKIFLHCMGGKGRTGTIAGIVLMLYGNSLKDTLNILKQSIKSRKIQGKCPKMPQTKSQHIQLEQLERIIFNDSNKDIYFYNKKDPYYEFSNYYKTPIVFKGKKYTSSEHIFQALKFMGNNATDKSLEYAEIIRKQSTANKGRILALQKTGGGYKWRTDLNPIIKKYQDVKLRDDWEEVKNELMEEILIEKFKNKKLKTLLLDTGDANIIEDSPRDSYWGIGKNGKGLNYLGRILMKVRKYYNVS